MSNGSGVFLDILSKVYDISFSTCFIVCPTFGYIAQYLKIKKTKSSIGFSKLISLILIIAYVFRVFFYIGEKFAISILLQAICGIIMQIFLIKQCIKYTNYSHRKNSNFFNFSEFWDWPYFYDYFYFVAFFTISLSLVSNLIGYDKKLYVEFLGFVSASSEAFLGVPQVIENYKSKTCKNLSQFLIISWVVGDLLKTIFYIHTKSPIQLILCGICQLVIDAIIILQVVYYHILDRMKLKESEREEIIYSQVDKMPNPLEDKPNTPKSEI